MANNRLYIGNTTAKKWFMLCKGFGSGWHGLSDKKAVIFNDFLMEDELIVETDIKGKTGFFFFTEYDECFDEIMNDESEWEEYKTKSGI